MYPEISMQFPSFSQRKNFPSGNKTLKIDTVYQTLMCQITASFVILKLNVFNALKAYSCDIFLFLTSKIHKSHIQCMWRHRKYMCVADTKNSKYLLCVISSF
eukprot:TRINITY_DN4313_c0_g1_i1.p1 TRINITY_DN4313_c0_g1~~TRINITY_DN4313_c0_g1_i1.p1  ORF type:complete len:102 (+),score=8.25 TRINITY_DN4313_c0_g1_i1:47-352(+)